MKRGVMQSSGRQASFGRRSVILMAVLVAVLLSSGGCTYMRHRGQDALDIFDVGLLVSDHVRPDFGLFLNFWNILPIGYAHVDGKLIGIGNGQVGILDFVHKDSWGVLAWGAEQHGVAAGANVSSLGPPRYDQGFLRLALGAEHEPPKHQYFDCDRTIHLGWIGVHLRIKLDDMADFFLGWFGSDIMNDDGLPRGWPAEARPSAGLGQVVDQE